MIVILASRFDGRAVSLAQRWQEQDARVLTPEALGRRGWSFDPAAPGAGSFVIHDDPLPVSRIDGVVSLLAAPHPDEFAATAPRDRAYVATEALAFLVAWLSALPCRVLNRPTPTNLIGPHLHDAQWVRAAAAVGLGVRPWSRRISLDPLVDETSVEAESDLRQVPLVAGRVVRTESTADLEPEVLAALGSLATRVGAGLMTAALSEVAELVTAVAGVDPTQDAVAEAMLRGLVGSP